MSLSTTTNTHTLIYSSLRIYLTEHELLWSQWHHHVNTVNNTQDGCLQVHTISRFTNLINKCTASAHSLALIDVPFRHNLHTLEDAALPKDALHICLPKPRGGNTTALTQPLVTVWNMHFSHITVLPFLFSPKGDAYDFNGYANYKCSTRILIRVVIRVTWDVAVTCGQELILPYK